MLCHESTKQYLCEDYLKLQQDHKDEFFVLTQPTKSEIDENCMTRHCFLQEDQAADEHTRQEVATWYSRLVCALQLNRQVFPVSMSYYDRFLSHYICDKSFVKLVAATCVFLAVKLYDPTKLPMV